MPKRLLALIAILLVNVNVFAGDPWKDKSYKQWDEKDIRKVLADSPWAKELRVTATWRGAREQGLGPEVRPSGTAGGGYGESSPGGMPMGAGPASGRPVEAEQGGGPPQAVFIVRWLSSRTIRQAMARAAMLRGAQEADAEKFLSQELPDYVLAVVGSDMSPFAGIQENGLLEKSYIFIRKTKAKLAPTRVEIQRPQASPGQPPAAGSPGVSVVLFHFAKKTAAGEPVLPADEKGVEFVCEAGSAHLKTNFELQKMVGSQGPDW